jgi:hypothetical protein
VVEPSTQLVPTSEPVAVDWPNAFVLPCRQPAPLSDGIVQPVRYRFSPGTDRELAGLSYDQGAGGPYAPLAQLAFEREVPTYLRGDKLRQPVTVFRFDYPTTPMRDVRPSHGDQEVSGYARNPPHLN